ncbi:hypothetical protein [Haloferula sp. BvORR071]|uniref:hypothetical protein n=1 Tax=Haloferula sp. BvORR071 TaxID=1396141 RepID=UPI00054D181D|nr:hypothetical protein [Haloferula sp. BvORR071]
MTPRPIYRWKSFWFGLLVLVFMGWAAWDSYQTRTGAVLFIPGSAYEVHAADAKFFLVTSDAVSDGFSLEWVEPGPLDVEAWKGRLAALNGPKVSEITFGAALAPFFLAWIGRLGWRWRKLHKASSQGLDGPFPTC